MHFRCITIYVVTLDLISEVKRIISVNDLQINVFAFRLTPVYMIILMAYTCLVDAISDGPSTPSPPDLFAAATCRTSWWKNLLYLNNFIMDEEVITNSRSQTDAYQKCEKPLSHSVLLDVTQCMFWTWYMANDFQFYVIAPLFIFLLYRSGLL